MLRSLIQHLPESLLLTVAALALFLWFHPTFGFVDIATFLAVLYANIAPH